MRASSSSSAIWPWPTPIARPARAAAHLRAIEIDVLDAVVDEVHLPPRASLARDRVADALVVELDDVASRIAERSFGGVSMIRMSRMPSSDMCSVRGIGVADIVSTSTFVASASRRSLCATPKRCSSSMTTRPRSLN